MEITMNVWNPHEYGNHIVADNIVATATIYPWSYEDGTDTSTILHSVDLTRFQLWRLMRVTEIDDEWLKPSKRHLSILNYKESN